MKKFFIPVICLVVGAFVGVCATYLSLSKTLNEKAILEHIVYEARQVAVKNNAKINNMTNNAGRMYLTEGSRDGYIAGVVLQDLFPNQLQQCKALRLDCCKYVNGEVMMAEDEGKKVPVEILPEVVRPF